MDIINFNHVDPNIDPVTLQAIENLYTYYHRLAYCYKKNHKLFSMKEKFCSYGGIFLIFIGTIVGGVTVNPIVFATLDSIGAALIALSIKGRYAQKTDRCRSAYIEFEKVINKLKNHRRGEPFNKMEFIKETTLIEEFVINQTPIISNRVNKKYKKKFNIKNKIKYI